MIERFEDVEDIHLFGSRAYATGSLRSDIDLLVKARRLVSLTTAQAMHREIPPIDIFRTTDGVRAESAINGSQIIARDSADLVTELGALRLWRRSDGFNERFERWMQETRVDIAFIPTVGDYPITRQSKVFIGHGRSPEWQKLSRWLSSELGLDCDEFNSVPTAGVPTVERLEEMLADARFAFLVATGEDIAADGSLHARENVVHEIGLFQGRLGFRNAVVVLEAECAEFTNIIGLGQIRFPKANIERAFEEIRRVLQAVRIL